MDKGPEVECGRLDSSGIDEPRRWLSLVLLPNAVSVIPETRDKALARMALVRSGRKWFECNDDEETGGFSLASSVDGSLSYVAIVKRRRGTRFIQLSRGPNSLRAIRLCDLKPCAD